VKCPRLPEIAFPGASDASDKVIFFKTWIVALEETMGQGRGSEVMRSPQSPKKKRHNRRGFRYIVRCSYSLNDRKRLLAHERLADLPLPPHTQYETCKRLDLFFGRLLSGPIKGTLLDAGCGRDFFTIEAARRGAQTVAVDIGPRLVDRVTRNCSCSGVVADVTVLPFKSNTFDVVISSEVIEHMREPSLAIAEMFRVTKSGGSLALSTPNKLWFPMIRLAEFLGIRKVRALENWIWPWTLIGWMRTIGFRVRAVIGFNFIPFIWPQLFGLVTFLDRLERLFPLAINIAILAEKPREHSQPPRKSAAYQNRALNNLRCKSTIVRFENRQSGSW